MKKTLILSVLLLLILGAKAQEKSYYFKNYQTVNGLSSNTVTSILQDKKGFMWFGTRNGLNRFDGSTFRTFQNIIGQPTSLGNNSILSLYESEREKLWIGTRNGIYIYDPVTETFLFNNSLPKGLIEKIQGDDKENVWILADGALFQFHSKTRKIFKHRWVGKPLRTFHVLPDGKLWAALSDGSLRLFDAKKQTAIHYTLPSVNGKPVVDINQVYPVGSNGLLLAAQNHLLLFDFSKNQFRSLSASHGKPIDFKAHGILKKTDQEYWIATEKGLYIVNIATSEITVVDKQYCNPYSITDNVIFQVYQDREGGVWLGTFFGGVNYYSQEYNIFKKHFPMCTPNSLGGNIVHEIAKDSQNRLWVGTEDAGLEEIDLASGQITHHKPSGTEGSISYSNIHGLCVDNDELWIGTFEHGLDVMDLNTKKVVRHYSAGQKKGLKSNFIVSLYKTKKGEILVGTWEGMLRYNRQSDDFTPIPEFGMQIQSMVETQDGTLWVGSYGSGVSFHNFDTGKTGKITSLPNSPQGLISNYVNSVYQDKEKKFWFCTERGLSRYDPIDQKFENYTSENGLPGSQVFKIHQDNQGLFWISTGNGLACLDYKTKKFRLFHTANGLPTEQFNYNSLYADPNGTLYFGTVKGMVSFNPASFEASTFSPSVFVTGIQVNNQPLSVKPDGLLRQSISHTKTIELPYHKANVSLDIAALSYIIPEMNEYRYRLEGAEETWTLLKNNRRIYYTNLSPGDYFFKVKGSNSAGVWNASETQLKIVILPPWWATSWAYIAYFLLGAGIIAVIFRYYHLAITEKNKRKFETIKITTEREIFNAKIEFFTNVAHEIRTPLTLIKMPLDKLSADESMPLNVKESLGIIKKNTNKLIDLTDQLLDFRKTEANKFSLSFTEVRIQDLLQEIFNDFRPTAEEKAISYTLEFPRHPLFAYVDESAVKKILANLIHNAIKYADAQVLVKLLPFSSEDQEFHVEVRNDGHVISEKYFDKIFEPFFRIKETDKQVGTGIGLPLSRSLAQLHKGDVRVQTSPDKMNVFLLSLAMHQDTEISLNTTQGEIPSGQEETKTDFADTDAPLLLLVEDNREILNYLGKELSQKYNVLKATNGHEALQILDNQPVQLVISDIMMPIMDGIELCRRVKGNIEYTHVPIILLTAKNSLNSKIEGLEVGADAYIEKPFAYDYLLAQIGSLLSNRKKVKEYFANSPLTHMRGMAYSKADKDFLEQLSQTIEANITDAELDVEKLSGMMNMSRPTLYRKIKGLSDLTPNELINLARLKKAASLLAQGNFKINEVALMVGYNSHSNFSRDFQRQFGVSPSVYVGNLPKE